MVSQNHSLPGDIVRRTGSVLVTRAPHCSSHTRDKNQVTKKSISTACQPDDWPTKQKILQPFVFSPGSDSVFYNNRGSAAVVHTNTGVQLQSSSAARLKDLTLSPNLAGYKLGQLSAVLVTLDLNMAWWDLVRSGEIWWDGETLDVDSNICVPRLAVICLTPSLGAQNKTIVNVGWILLCFCVCAEHRQSQPGEINWLTNSGRVSGCNIPGYELECNWIITGSSTTSHQLKSISNSQWTSSVLLAWPKNLSTRAFSSLMI